VRGSDSRKEDLMRWPKPREKPKRGLTKDGSRRRTEPLALGFASSAIEREERVKSLYLFFLSESLPTQREREAESG